MPLPDIDDTDIWYRWYRYRYQWHRYRRLISMIPIGISITNTCYRLYRYLISMVPIPTPDIDSDVWYRWYLYRCVISRIPIPMPYIDDTDIAGWYRWDRCRYLISIALYKIDSTDTDINYTNPDIVYIEIRIWYWDARSAKRFFATRYRYRYLICIIPIQLSDIDDTDAW